VAATSAGYAQLLELADSAASGWPEAWAIEGTRHYGLGLARHLAGNGHQVAEIDSTRHISKRRAGKSDPIDAERAARELLARQHPAQMRRRRPRDPAAVHARPRQRRGLSQDRPHRAGLGPGHRPG
jgi:transposase